MEEWSYFTKAQFKASWETSWWKVRISGLLMDPQLSIHNTQVLHVSFSIQALFSLGKMAQSRWCTCFIFSIPGVWYEVSVNYIKFLSLHPFKNCLHQVHMLLDMLCECPPLDFWSSVSPCQSFPGINSKSWKRNVNLLFLLLCLHVFLRGNIHIYLVSPAHFYGLKFLSIMRSLCFLFLLTGTIYIQKYTLQPQFLTFTRAMIFHLV